MPRPKKKPPVEAPSVEARYPELRAVLYTAASGEGPITAEHAKAWLGWTPETNHDFGDDFLLKDQEGVKVRCSFNDRNRPFNEAWCRTLAQDILNRNWADSRNGPDSTINGETIVIGRSGLILSGQHRLIGLILAEQMRVSSMSPKKGGTAHKDHWAEKWDSPVTIEGLVVFGVSESSCVVRTLDNVRPRSFGDVLYTEEAFREDADGKPIIADARKNLCRAAEHAVRLLWSRTGRGEEAFSPKATHSERLEFISRHRRLLEAVVHVTDEDGDNGIKNYVSRGYASAALYLMACSASDGQDYHVQESPSEAHLDFSRWDRACEFWTDFAHSARLGALRTCMTPPEGELRLAEKLAYLARAWEHYKDGRDPTADEMDLSDFYMEDPDDGTRRLIEHPSFGGIDIPPDRRKEELEDEQETEVDHEPDLEEKPKPPAPSKMMKEIDQYRDAHPGALILFKSPTGYVGFGPDASALAEAHGGEAGPGKDGNPVYRIKDVDAEMTLGELHRGGTEVMVGTVPGPGKPAEFIRWLPADLPHSTPEPEPAPEEPKPKRKGPGKPKLRGGTN